MKLFYILLAVGVVVSALRYASQRIATHQRVVPNPLAFVNTQVHRINQ